MSKVILLIDDDKDDRELFKEALSAVGPGWVCHCYEEGRAALTTLKNKEMTIPRIIFLDINLPIMSGWQCLTQLKRDNTLKDIPVIMYSTSSNKRDKDIAIELGAESFITKPNDYNELKTILKDITRKIEG